MRDNKEEISTTGVDSENEIQAIIDFLIRAKKTGATHVHFDIPNPNEVWQFKFLRTFKHLTKEEVKQKEIERLKKELRELRGK